MKSFWFTSESSSLFWKPGANWVFTLIKNSSSNKLLRFITVEPLSCVWTSDSVKVSLSDLSLLLYEVIPLNPLIHPVKVFLVFQYKE